MNDEFATRLADEGFNVDVASDVIEAYVMLIEDNNDYNYDIVILDLFMDSKFLGEAYPKWSHLGGYCLLRKIVEAKIKIQKIIYTHIDDPELKAAAKKEGILFFNKGRSSARHDTISELINKIKVMSHDK